MKQALLSGMVLLAAQVTTCEAATRYVSLGGNNTSPYTNWAMAATSLNYAISADGDTIIVSNGIYRLNNSSKIDIWKSVTITRLYGAAQTVFDGGGGAHYGFRIGYNYVTAKVYGVTITNFFGSGFYKAGAGGEITFDSCIVAGNSNSFAGGGFCILTGSLSVTNCIISGNTTADMGGGIDLWTGGTGTCRVDNCIIINNRSIGRYGSGISAAQAVIVQNCTIANNVGSGTTPAGIYLEDFPSRIANSVIVSNAGGCGVWANGSRPIMENCLVAHHTNSGVVSFGTLRNCTVVSNPVAAANGGGVHGSGTAINCIVYFNNSGMAIRSNYCDTVFINSCTAPLPAGAGNIAVNPKMINIPADCRLLKGSPCINTGLCQSWMMTNAVDLDGRARIREGLVDMGAYEWIPKCTVFRGK